MQPASATYRREPLLRGPLILTALSRIVMLPFFALCALGTTYDLRIFYHHLADYRELYVVDLVASAASMWTFLLLSMLLAFLFFSRHRMFRPLMVYFSLLPPLFLIGMSVHLSHFPPRHHRHANTHTEGYWSWIAVGLLLTFGFWPLYYMFSPRVKRVFTR